MLPQLQVLLLTTEAMVAKMPEPKEPMPPMPGGSMGGMGGMGSMGGTWVSNLNLTKYLQKNFIWRAQLNLVNWASLWLVI